MINSDRLKPAAKKFANKFATGASVSKNNQNQDEIIVQGDVSDEIFDFLTEDKFFKAVPEDNIDCIEGLCIPTSGLAHANFMIEKRKSVK